ncbi:hypothetical protein [Nocardioides sp.]|uniref:hypothetical protein n=1 Tax=Nocardioides sp. TaxID=35761 RepID=UPI00271FA68E|nr:hypothetical protein [Nocardioides sp.]MDO9457013.1 hypothetical protein [Nocardioides sp.]
MRRLALLTCALLTCALLLAVPGSARADTWSGPDPTGDAVTYGYDPDPPPCGTETEGRSRNGDIRRLAVRHTGDDVTLVLRVVGLGKLKQIYLSLPLRTNRRSYDVVVDFPGKRPVRASLWTPTTYGEPSEPDECGNVYVGGGAQGLGCPEIAASFDRPTGRVTVTLPRSCLGTPRWVQAGASVQGTHGNDVVVLDHWQRPGTGDDDFRTPDYGARVRHSNH